MEKYAIVYSERLNEYDLGHVLTEDRYRSFMDLYEKTLGKNPAFEVVAPPYATDSDLQLVHTAAYLERIERCESRDPFDTPLSPSFIRAARLLAGSGKLAGEVVVSGRYRKAFVIGGGVQHAAREREKGFGVYSDIGVCTENLRRNHGVERVMIVDTDAHAGDGVYEIFSEDTQVLYLSLHQDPRTIYPGKGFVEEIGIGPGRGYSVNIPLPPWTGDLAYEHVLQEIFNPLAQEFAPEIILMVDGCDPHFSDRITQMGLTLNGIRHIGRLIGETADRVCNGKMVDFVGSGYSSNLRIVALGWLASIAGTTGTELVLEEPEPIPPGLGADQGLAPAGGIVRKVKKELSGFWKCFAD